MTHFRVYRETQYNSVTRGKILRETQNILRHSESHQQVFTVLESSGIKMRFAFLTKTGFYVERRRPRGGGAGGGDFRKSKADRQHDSLESKTNKK